MEKKLKKFCIYWSAPSVGAYSYVWAKNKNQAKKLAEEGKDENFTMQDGDSLDWELDTLEEEK